MTLIEFPKGFVVTKIYSAEDCLFYVSGTGYFDGKPFVLCSRSPDLFKALQSLVASYEPAIKRMNMDGYDLEDGCNA